MSKLSALILQLSRLGRTAPSRVHLDADGWPAAGGSRDLVQKGISYATWQAGAYSEPDADLALEHLRATGANWISLIVTQYQDGILSTDIRASAQTPTDADVQHVIAVAHRLGLKVMLKPHVDLRNDDPRYSRSLIGIAFTPSRWPIWFASYRAFINRYADLAQAYGADQFCVGTELDSSIGRVADWRAVIRDVRGRYRGPLTYASNWTVAPFVGWWDALDFIGVDAYPPLSLSKAPSLPELRAAWRLHVAALTAVARAWSKPVLLTEIGYRSLDGANMAPWDWWKQGAVDLQEQANCYQAALKSVFTQPWFAGMFWWAWGVDPLEGGPYDTGFTPHDKPTEDVLRRWYGAPPRENPRVPEPDYARSLEVYTDALGAGWADWSWNAEVDVLAADSAQAGTRAISVKAGPLGALSLHHENLDSGPYDWLEFDLRQSAPGQRLYVFVNDENDAGLRQRPVDDGRYTAGQRLQPGIWTRVRIPLADLNAGNRSLQRVSIQNQTGEISSFWVDEIRFLPARRDS